MNFDSVLQFLVGFTLACPALLLLVLVTASVFQRPLPERLVGPLCALLISLSGISLLTIYFILEGSAHSPVISLGQWFEAGSVSFHLVFILDRISLIFSLLTVATAGTVAAFSHRYLHREPGYNRYFILFSVFVLGMLLVALSGSVELLFTGWELLGISSALLVGFFHERPAPVKNALRVFVVYRISDAALLSAAVLLHHFLGTGDIWPMFYPHAVTSEVALTGNQAVIISLLLFVAIAGKCAQLPFAGWLPRAMEGPTPSSGIFYGALSVHAGCYLLLRVSPIVEAAPPVNMLIAITAIFTAIYATLSGRTQTDIKSVLAFASLTQVSIILAEIALGFRLLPFLHLIGHSCLRLLQFLRAPTLLHDFHETRNALGRHFTPAGTIEKQATPHSAKLWLYLIALERGYGDAILDRFIAAPLERLAHRCDQFERKICDTLIQITTKNQERNALLTKTRAKTQTKTEHNRV